jgi:nucleotide-binding universal stress UspA family protein
MQTINHILFPMDFSERCCHVVPFVKTMARRFSAKVTLLSVVQPYYYASIGDPSAAVAIDLDELLQDLQTRLDSSLTQEFAGLHVDRVAQLGDPARVITEFAHANGVDLIMMQTHGYGPFRNLLLGSVTAKVLHDAECAVWTSAHVSEKPSAAQAACHDILCALDGTGENASLLKWAGEFSREAGATLRLVHVAQGMELPEQARQELERLQESVGLHEPICVATGDIAETIRDEVRRHDANLVVIGRGALNEKLGRLRSHTYGIIRQSPCPVLSV